MSLHSGGHTFDFDTAVSTVRSADRIEITSESETTRVAGTPASEALVTLTMSGRNADAFWLGVQNEGTEVLAAETAMTLAAPPDDSLLAEMAHTLQFE